MYQTRPQMGAVSNVLPGSYRPSGSLGLVVHMGDGVTDICHRSAAPAGDLRATSQIPASEIHALTWVPLDASHASVFTYSSSTPWKPCCRQEPSGRCRHHMSATCTVTWLSGALLSIACVKFHASPHLACCCTQAFCFPCLHARSMLCMRCTRESGALHQHPPQTQHCCRCILSVVCHHPAGLVRSWRTLCGARWSPGGGRCTRSRARACLVTRCGCAMQTNPGLLDDIRSTAELAAQGC
jgi:hypothetical protein